ncbi:hypothetical protein M5689_024629 [Euphorbia peplus]|nr:hypothetical protein M5689_024629 [Euphorbia peplus]
MNAGDWFDVFVKHGPAMWLQIKNKFSIKDSCTQLLRLQAFATDVMQRAYRYWKCRLHYYYKECGDTYEERLKYPPDDFPIASWRACCATFNSEKFKIISARNSKNRNSENWNKHTTGNLSFPELEHLMTQQNGGVLPPADVVWLAEHTHTNDQGVLEWVDDDGRSKEIHKQLHQLVQDKDKEPDGDEARPQTQEEMLRHVLGSRSGYTRGKGNGYRGSAKAILQQEQQRQPQDQILNLKSELEGSQNQIANLQNELQANKKQMEDMEKRIMDMIKRNSRVQSHEDNDDASDHE